MYNKSWSAKNNPFSVSVGQRVHDALNREDAGGSLPWGVRSRTTCRA